MKVESTELMNPPTPRVGLFAAFAFGKPKRRFRGASFYVEVCVPGCPAVIRLGVCQKWVWTEVKFRAAVRNLLPVMTLAALHD